MEKASELEKTDRSDGSRLKVRVQVLNGSWEEFDARIKEHRAKLKISKKFFTNLEEVITHTRTRAILEDKFSRTFFFFFSR